MRAVCPFGRRKVWGNKLGFASRRSVPAAFLPQGTRIRTERYVPKCYPFVCRNDFLRAASPAGKVLIRRGLGLKAKFSYPLRSLQLQSECRIWRRCADLFTRDVPSSSSRKNCGIVRRWPTCFRGRARFFCRW